MFTTMARNRVEAALNAPRALGYFTARMRALAAADGVDLAEADREALCQYGAHYARGSLRLLESCAVAAGQARLTEAIAPLLATAAAAFTEPPAEAPDQDGLFGVVANAYLSRRIVEGASARFEARRGFSLFSSDPHPKARLVRQMIGEDLAEMLDARAAATLARGDIRLAIHDLSALQTPLRASPRLSEWEADWEDGIGDLARAVGAQS